ncbi:MAG TPA: MoaD/ThiS family protein [Acidimicrobiales bacterium]
MTHNVRVVLPAHLKTLARVTGEVTMPVNGPVCAGAIIDVLETTFPPLRGTIRDPTSGKRRPFIRFFVGEDDLSHQSLDDPLPAEVANGTEVFYVIGAMAGG